MKYFQISLAKFVTFVSILVHNLSDTDDFSIKITDRHAHHGMCRESSLNINVSVEAWILEFNLEIKYFFDIFSPGLRFPQTCIAFVLLTRPNVNRIERLGSKLPLESLPTPLVVYIFFFLARPPATVFTFFCYIRGTQTVRFSAYDCPTLYSINVERSSRSLCFGFYKHGSNFASSLKDLIISRD